MTCIVKVGEGLMMCRVEKWLMIVKWLVKWLMMCRVLHKQYVTPLLCCHRLYRRIQMCEIKTRKIIYGQWVTADDHKYSVHSTGTRPLTLFKYAQRVNLSNQSEKCKQPIVVITITIIIIITCMLKSTRRASRKVPGAMMAASKAFKFAAAALDLS